MKFLTVILTCFAAPLAAHPHIFVDTGLKLIVSEEGFVTGVEVSWRYDALYSLLVLEDMELDHDFDGVLTEAEKDEISGFDLQWIPEFEGDLFVFSQGTKLELSPPENLGTSLQDGQIISRHFREIKTSAESTSVLIKAYDPTYYTQYDLRLGVDVPEGCDVSISKANVEAANAMVRATMGDDMDRLANDPNADWPAVGEAYADDVRVTCGAGS